MKKLYTGLVVILFMFCNVSAPYAQTTKWQRDLLERLDEIEEKQDEILTKLDQLVENQGDVTQALEELKRKQKSYVNPKWTP